jgi:microcystin-dependent protein
MRPDATANTGGSQPQTNVQPYLAVNFIIALEGTFPSRN